MRNIIFSILMVGAAYADQSTVVINQSAVNPVIKLNEIKLSKSAVVWGNALGYISRNTEARTRFHGHGAQVNIGGYAKVGDVTTLGLAVTYMPQIAKSRTTSDKTNTYLATLTFARMLSDRFSVWGAGSLGKLSERFDFLSLNSPARTSGSVQGASLGVSYATKLSAVYVQPFLAVRYNGSDTDGYLIQNTNQYIGHERLFATKLEVGTALSVPVSERWHVYAQPRYQYTLDKDSRSVTYDKSTVVAELGVKYSGAKVYYLFQRSPAKTTIHGVGVGYSKSF